MLSHLSSLIWASPTSYAPQSHFAFTLIVTGLRSLSLKHRISHVHCMVFCKHAVSHDPGSPKMVDRFCITISVAGFIISDSLADCTLPNEANLFAFATAYLPRYRALPLASRLLVSISLPPERTIGCAGLAPASHATLRGAPDFADKKRRF